MYNESLKIKRRNMINILSERENFLIIGLTGRIGSGCSETAEILGSSYTDLELPWIQPNTEGLTNDHERDLRILQRYASAHWLKFDIIRSRTIISTFLINELDKFLDFIKYENKEKNILKKELYDNMFTHISKDIENNYSNISYNSDMKKFDLDKMVVLFYNVFFVYKKLFEIFVSEEENIEIEPLKYDELKNGISQIKDNEELKKLSDYDTISKIFAKILETDINVNEKFEEIKTKIRDDNVCNRIASLLDILSINLFDKLSSVYPLVDEGDGLKERSRFLNEVESLLFFLSKIHAYIYISNVANHSDFFDKLKNDNNILDSKYDNKVSTDSKFYVNFSLAHDILPAFGQSIFDLISKNNNVEYTELFQKYGNCIRKYGKIIFDEKEYNDIKDDMFSIPKKMNTFIKALRHPFGLETNRPVRIAIDSIKNVFEATYLRQRYSAFYLFAISSNELIREKRLMEGNKKLSVEQIRFIDWNEYSSTGCSIYQNGKKWEKAGAKKEDEPDYFLTDFEKDFYEKVKKGDINDLVRKDSYDKEQQQFYLQDVAASIESADVFISNNHSGNTKNKKLCWEVVRNVCLIMFPGLLLPTPVERCMQVAFSAKCNSGCLSRKVGAVVADKHYNILSVGWNDVPAGDISCARKNLVDLCKYQDEKAYSNYELESTEFRKKIAHFKHTDRNLSKYLRGLPMCYCFKDVHQNKKNPMRSRAMHAEEKALANCGENAINGILFTTSSPCEMCSKNAKNHKIKKIYYIELYPGISESQYSNSGDKDNIAEHILFTGAVGRAYMQMYTPIMPHKDILDFLGIKDVFWE